MEEGYRLEDPPVALITVLEVDIPYPGMDPEYPLLLSQWTGGPYPKQTRRPIHQYYSFDMTS